MQLARHDQIYKQDYWFLIIRLKRFGYIRCDIIVSFLPRDAMRKRGLCCRRCLSVCLSVCHVGARCIQTAEDVRLL